MKLISLLLVLLSVSFVLAQPGPNMFNKQNLDALNQKINKSDSTNYVLHWRRAKLLGRMLGGSEQLSKSERKTLHNDFLNDIGLLIDNEIELEGFKEVTIAHYYYTRANYYFAINEHDKAVHDYKIVIEKDERDMLTKQVYYRLLAMHESNKEYDSAIFYCDKLILRSIEQGVNACSCESESSLCSRKAELLYHAGKYKELLDYLKDLFSSSYNHNESNKDVYCYLNLYREYYRLLTPSELSKYKEEDLNEDSVIEIIQTMEVLNNKVE